MYLLFADESGTHGGSHAFVVGGIAVHEHDAQNLQRSLAAAVEPYALAARLSPEDFELHASVMRNASPPSGSRSARPVSPWALIPRQDRLRCLADAYRRIANFRPSDPDLPIALFGVVLDLHFHSAWSTIERERFAYEVMLNKFDVMLKRLRQDARTMNRGLVIHDRRVVAERDIQEWTREWQKAAGTIGQLRNMADVPLFADSRASRLIQQPTSYLMPSTATMIRAGEIEIMSKGPGRYLMLLKARCMDAFTLLLHLDQVHVNACHAKTGS